MTDAQPPVAWADGHREIPASILAAIHCRTDPPQPGIIKQPFDAHVLAADLVRLFASYYHSAGYTIIAAEFTAWLDEIVAAYKTGVATREKRERHPYQPAEVLPPGETLREWMDEANTSAHALGESTGLGAAIIQGILDATTAITWEIASPLSRVTKISDTFWLSLQHNYDERHPRS